MQRFKSWQQELNIPTVGVGLINSGKITKAHLPLTMAGVPNLDLFDTAKDSFFLLDIDPTYAFERDNHGVVNTAWLLDDDNTIRCERESASLVEINIILNFAYRLSRMV